MKDYIVYFAKNKDFNEAQEFAFEYSVKANSEAEAKEKAIAVFNENNPELHISDYTMGFSKC